MYLLRVLPLFVLLLGTPTSPAFGDDPCAGRNPRFCHAVDTQPIVCGYIRVRPEGSIATTHDYVCRQGDHIISVRQGRDHNYNIDDVKEREY